MADPNQLSRRERYLVHQIHPAKLATNVSVSVISTMLFWQPPARAGLLVFTVPSPVACALVLGLDLSGYRDSAAGRYVLAHMPLSMQAIRSLSAVTIAIGGWRLAAQPGAHRRRGRAGRPGLVPRAAPRTPPLRHATSGRTTNDQAAVASGVVASGRPAACSSQPPVSIPPVGQSAMRRATAGRILDAWRAGHTVARIEATAAAATSTAMLAQGIGKPTPEAFSSSSFLNSR
jgi:hypothetical protein